MQFEKIRRINKSKIIVGGVIGLGVIGAITILPSFAKYRLTDSINIANGTVNYKVPDFKVMAMFTSEDGTNYTEIEGRMPSNGYTINESKSYCNLNGEKDTNATLKTVEGNHIISNIIKGDKCYLYFDKEKTTSEKTLAKLNITVKDTTPNFSQVATIDEGVYKVSDGMYGDYSYYWRGAVENNYLKFAGFCWRIVRINGDGSIRLIYDGTTCHENGTKTANNIIKTSQAYNVNYDRSEYVGYTYVEGKQRPEASDTSIESNLKTQTETWYKTNITDKGFDGKVANGKFCNDRDMRTGYTWSSQPSSSIYYASYERLDRNKKPSLECLDFDIYTLKVGAITADEVSFAGGYWNELNFKYYLYNSKYYWTMTPSYWSATNNCTHVAIVGGNGELGWYNVKSLYNIRPVINLRSDTTFSSGDGTLNNPYIVQ